MVSTDLDVARWEGPIDPCEDAGESQPQENRRGTLAVKSGPPTRGRGGVADSLRPLRVDDCGPPVRQPRSYYRPDRPRVERHSASPSLFVAGRLLGTSPGAGPSSPSEPRETDSLTLAGISLGSAAAVLSLAGTGGRGDHGAELPSLEPPVSPADPVLTVECGAPVLDPDRGRDAQPEGRGDHEADDDKLISSSRFAPGCDALRAQRGSCIRSPRRSPPS